MAVRKDIFIADLDVDMPMSIDYFQASEVAVKQTKRGSDYLALTLRDRTGQIDARMWDVPGDLKVSGGDYVKAEFVVENYQGKRQLKISRMKVVDAAEVSVDEFLPTTEHDVAEMWEKLMDSVNCVEKSDIRFALLRLLTDYAPRMMKAPAAKSKHQAYIGGLLEHTLAIVSVVEAVCDTYDDLNRAPLDRDVLIAGAVLHDIGKVEELTYDKSIDYSIDGTLIGHITQGIMLWAQYDGDINEIDRRHIRHIILSHHGRREWGSPVVPATREAMVFHLIDMIDSRMGIVDLFLKANEGVEITPYDRTLETMMWRPNGKKIEEAQGRQLPQGVGEPRSESGENEVKGDAVEAVGGTE